MRFPRRVGRGPGSLLLALFLLGHAAWHASGQSASSNRSLPTPAAKADQFVSAPLDFAQKSFPDAMLGVPYQSSVLAIGGSGIYGLSVTGDMPPGLSMESGTTTVAFGGVPTETGTFKFQIHVRDADGAGLNRDFTIEVLPRLPGANATTSINARDSEAITVTDVAVVFLPVQVIVHEAITLTDSESFFDSVFVVDYENITLTDTEPFVNSAFLFDRENITLTDTESERDAVEVSDPETIALTDAITVKILTASTITWPQPAPIMVGTALSATQLDATASDSGTFVYSPPAGTVLPAGLNTLSVAFTPSIPNLYAPATATVQLAVDQAAALTGPAAGSTLTGSSATFTWTAGFGVAAYWLNVGTASSGANAKNIYNSGSTAALSAAVAGIPTYGQKIYATLYSEIGGVYQPTLYTFTESGAPVPAVLTSPTPGSQFSSSSVTFTWTPGGGVTNYWFNLGTAASGTNAKSLYSSGSVTVLTETVSGLPTNGEPIYATLYSYIGGAFQPTVYTFYATGPAVLITPAPGAALTSSTTFTWTPGTGIAHYWLNLGTADSGANAKNLFSSGSITALTASVTGIPQFGETLYATLYSYIAGAWQPIVYPFTAAGSPVAAVLTTPTPGTKLATSSVTFSWTAGEGVTEYWFNLGTADSGANAKNIYAGSPTTLTSVAVTGLPTNGETIYATLYSYIAGEWQPTIYTYTAQ